MPAALTVLSVVGLAALLMSCTQRADQPSAAPATSETTSATPVTRSAEKEEKAATPKQSPAPREEAAPPAPANQNSEASGSHATASAKKDLDPAKKDVGTAKKDSGSDVFRAIKGRWLRPDGDYVLEVKSIDADGKVQATYANPNPIHISEAKASREGSTVKLFVELRDSGYPGCTYTLTYDPQNDILRGVYFQAAMQEKFEVGFERLP
jgi:hypothetical protein